MQIAGAVGKAFTAVKDVAMTVGSGVVDIGSGLLTSGLATGSFGSYQSASGVGSFFNLVGNVLGAGGGSVTGALGIGGGAANSKFINNMMNTMKTAGGVSQQQNYLDQLGKMRTQSMLAQGIMGGISHYAKKREERKERERQNKSAVFGVRRRGSDGKSGLLQFPSFSVPQGTSQGGSFTQQGGVPVGHMQGPPVQQQQPLLAQQGQNQQQAPQQQQGMQQTYLPQRQQNFNAQQAYYG